MITELAGGAGEGDDGIGFMRAPETRALSEHKYAYPLILNKVASPRYATPTLRRARLIDWLNEAATGRATVINADAGYGKTTLLWQWEREVEFPCYWYKLDRNDRDWTLHISYLAESIAKRHPGFGRRTHSMLEQMGGPGSSRPGVTAYLLAEMHKRLTEPCTFIIDDWHYVNAVTEVRGLWNQILRDAPSTCRFVFASRVKPILQFARFKTHGGYAELKTDALRFKETEIEELFRDVYNDPLEPAEICELERRTEGWAASLQLIEVSLRDRNRRDDRLGFINSITATRDTDLFEYLAEEVLDQQPEETRDFLLATSILQQITGDLAERLTGSHDGHRRLASLERQGLFTNRVDESRYRYHHLFREFLERRLAMERAEAEITGLHIHAASYYETTEQWPSAIHHYLRAKLQRQAARLMAKHGEELISEGRLGLVDEWLQQLRKDTIRSNARLSLLHGEASGIRGDWTAALDSLNRARSFFARKGDVRQEALAHLKLSTVYSNMGDPTAAHRTAQAGASLVPDNAAELRLRLAGNIAITGTWMSASMDVVAAECSRIASEARLLGLEHIAAIADHNAGGLLLRMGQADRAVESLERAAAFWSEPMLSPFADNSELVLAYLVLGQVEKARHTASAAVRRTAPWPRAQADSLYGQALVYVVDARLDEAAAALERARADRTALGGLHSLNVALLIELNYLMGRWDQIPPLAVQLAELGVDPRYDAEAAAAEAIAYHVSTPTCDGRCREHIRRLDSAEANGNVLVAALGRLKFAALATHHPEARPHRLITLAISEARRMGLWRLSRPWLRSLSSAATSLARGNESAQLLAALAVYDPESWRDSLVAALPRSQGTARQALLAAIERTANKSVLRRLRDVPGEDVARVRRRLGHLQAPKLYLRTLGGVALHRTQWDGPQINIEKRRVRALLAVLGAHHGATLTRDVAIDTLWPDADPDAAVNSLNQTVYQLRRYIDPEYRGGESAEYVFSTAERVGLNPDLVATDLGEIRRLPARLSTRDWAARQSAALRAIRLLRGEFLADLRYEDWVSALQLRVHAEIRELLLPVAHGAVTSFTADVSVQAAAALLALDPYDEVAVVSLAENLNLGGRRAAARRIVTEFIERLDTDLDLKPAAAVVAALEGSSQVNHDLTVPRPH